MSFIKGENITYFYPKAEDFEDEFAVPEKKKRSEENEEALEETPVEDVPALSDVDIKIEQGQFVCILGRNGSGKSTLARHFNALLCPSEGTLWVDGKSSSEEENVWSIRTQVGMVFQNPDNQIIGSVVDEDVAFGLENLGVPSEEIQNKVKEVLESVNMSKFAKSSPNHLSGGQKQRIAVAGVMAMEPKCIVLDEATAMLDPIGRDDVMKTAIELNKNKGITLIVITHYMDETLLADKVFVMNKGHIILEGTPKEVFSEEEKIEEAGLKLPQIAQLSKKLREKGMDVPKDIITPDELISFLSSL